MTNQKDIRVRIAPSPTGYFHIGTARTALFNFLFARHTGGKFIVRIEDTDLERSEKKFEENILSGLSWLGLVADESPEVGGPYGPYRQSERLDIYEKYIQKLLDGDSAYCCFCTEEELEEERQKMTQKGLAPKYSGKCRAKNAKSGGAVIRFKIPEEKITFTDLIRGEITFDGAFLGDIAIAKNPRTPLYNFAVVIDDFEMKISHVIRGEDHIANTPKQIFIAKKLGFDSPCYAHLPLILDKDRAKLSKRYSAVSVDDYRHEGFLPEALINFMSLLGWHSKEEKELMPLRELADEFSLERVQKAGAIFNIEKLRWMNGQYIKKTDDSTLLDILSKEYPELNKKFLNTPREHVVKFIALVKDRLETLGDFEKQSQFLFEIGEYDASLLIWKETSKETIKLNLELVLNKLENITLENFIKSELENIVSSLSAKTGRGELYWPLRTALSGLDKSPGPIEIMDALGKDESLKRIRAAIKKLASL